MSIAASSPAKSVTNKRSLKDLSAPADETISADEEPTEEDLEHKPKSSSRKKSTTLTTADSTEPKRKNSAEERNTSIEPASSAFYYCGCKYVKGSSFDMAFGRDLGKTFSVTLIQVLNNELQVRKNGDGSKIKISLDDLISGSVVILSQQ